MLAIDTDHKTDPDLLIRVQSEYTEMPGLQLTIAQAARLWNVDRVRSAQVLETLVGRCYLRRAGDVYVRADSGRSCA